MKFNIFNCQMDLISDPITFYLFEKKDSQFLSDRQFDRLG